MCFKSKKISDISDDSLEEMKNVYLQTQKDYVVVIVIKDNKKEYILLQTKLINVFIKYIQPNIIQLLILILEPFLMSSEFIGIENIIIPVLTHNIGEVDREQIISLSL
jgi:hypothetical protein